MEKILRKIFKLHQKPLHNLQRESNANRVICFAGVPGSGKSFLAKSLEEKYKAVHFDKGRVRDIINTLSKEEIMQASTSPEEVFKTRDKERLKDQYLIEELTIQKENLAKAYVRFFFKNYSFKNRLVILDASVDRSYEETKKLLEECGFKLFLIRMPLNEQQAYQRVKDRGEGDMTFFTKNLPRWKQDYEQCKEHVRANLEYAGDLEEVYETINKILK